jgi:hypothetical protein
VATKFTKIFSGSQPRQVVEWRVTNLLKFVSIFIIAEMTHLPNGEDSSGPRNFAYLPFSYKTWLPDREYSIE